MRLEPPLPAAGVPNDCAPQGALDALPELELEAVGDHHAVDAVPQGACRGHPPAGVAGRPGPAMDVRPALQGFDAVAVAEPSTTIEVHLQERGGSRLPAAKQRSAAEALVQGVPAGFDAHAGQRGPCPPSAEPGGHVAVVLTSVISGFGPAVKPGACTPNGIVTYQQSPSGLTGAKGQGTGKGHGGFGGSAVSAPHRAAPSAELCAEDDRMLCGVGPGGHLHERRIGLGQCHLGTGQPEKEQGP